MDFTYEELLHIWLSAQCDARREKCIMSIAIESGNKNYYKSLEIEKKRYSSIAAKAYKLMRVTEVGYAD